VKKVVSGLVLMSFLVGCANVYTPSQTTYECAAVGATTGALVGAILSECVAVGATTGALAGAILSKDNKWKGGMIGGVIGAIAGATITEIAKRGAQEVRVKDQ
jgi:predicted MFS family arabinose efflux permease